MVSVTLYTVTHLRFTVLCCIPSHYTYKTFHNLQSSWLFQDRLIEASEADSVHPTEESNDSATVLTMWTTSSECTLSGVVCVVMTVTHRVPLSAVSSIIILHSVWFGCWWIHASLRGFISYSEGLNFWTLFSLPNRQVLGLHFEILSLHFPLVIVPSLTSFGSFDLNKHEDNQMLCPEIVSLFWYQLLSDILSLWVMWRCVKWQRSVWSGPVSIRSHCSSIAV